MKKILTLLFIVCLLSLTTISAWTDTSFEQDLNKIEELKTKTNYGTYEIKKYSWYDPLKIWTERISKTIELKNNTDVCVNCLAELEIDLKEDGILVEDVLFKRLINGKWVNWNSFSNWNIYVEEDVDVYETQCIQGKEIFNEKNGTSYFEQECSQVKTGTRKQWNPLKLNEEYNAGAYKIKLTGGKKSIVSYDWLIKTDGQILSDWAVWGNISAGDDAEVILNSPADGSTALTNLITFNASANVTGGAYLTNMSFCSNLTGSWGCGDSVNISNIDASSNTWYYTLDETSGTTAYDLRESGANLAHQNTPTMGITGKINYSTSYNGVDEYSTGSRFDTNKNLSHCNWINTYTTPSGPYSIIKQRTSGTNNVWELSYSSNGRIDMGTAQNGMSASIAHTNNVWTFYCVTLDMTAKNITLYKNGVNVNSSVNPSWSGLDAGTYQNALYIMGHPDIGWAGDGAGYLNGSIDELSFWNKTLSPEEITQLYNSGDGIRVLGLSTSSTQTWSKTIPAGSTLWDVQACDSDGDCDFATSNYTVSLDATAPTIEINSGNGTFDYGILTQNHTINFTVTDTNLDKVWFNYNGTNTTITGATSGVMNSTSFALVKDLYNATIYANDSVGNLESQVVTWDYLIFENSRTHNTSSYETAKEGYSTNITANSSLTAVSLNYNGTLYSMSQSGNIWSYSRDLPTSVLGNNSINFRYTYAGNTINSDYETYQNVEHTIFTICNSTYSNDFLNITFKDEADLSSINASIPTSTFEYYLGDGTVTKTYTYLNSSDNEQYGFCASPTDRNLYIDPYVQYKQGSSYPQRIYDPDVLTLTSDTTSKILYLLSSADGIYTTFQVITQANVPISGVTSTASRTIDSETVIIGTGTTDAAGSVTYWVNPDFSHTFSFTKTGYGSASTTITPTQSSYTVSLSSTSNYTYVSNVEGLRWAYFPRTVLTNTSTNFGFNITSIYDNIEACKIELLDNDKTVTLATGETNATNNSLCSVSVAYTPNASYPQIKGRLLVDIGEGYQILEEDAYWYFLPYEGTGLTFTDWFNSLTNLSLDNFNGASPEIQEQHREYTYILLFFLIVAVICAVLNYAGWDTNTGGGMIYLMGAFVWFASVPGFLTLSGISPIDLLNKYFLALVYTMFMVGFVAKEFT